MKYVLLFLICFNVNAKDYFHKAKCLAEKQEVSTEGYDDGRIFISGDINIPKDTVIKGIDGDGNIVIVKTIKAKKHLVVTDDGSCDAEEAAWIQARELRRNEMKKNFVDHLKAGNNPTPKQLRKALIYLLEQ
jgi:hypothetical protein